MVFLARYYSQYRFNLQKTVNRIFLETCNLKITALTKRTAMDSISISWKRRHHIGRNASWHQRRLLIIALCFFALDNHTTSACSDLGIIELTYGSIFCFNFFPDKSLSQTWLARWGSLQALVNHKYFVRILFVLTNRGLFAGRFFLMLLLRPRHRSKGRHDLRELSGNFQFKNAGSSISDSWAS